MIEEQKTKIRELTAEEKKLVDNGLKELRRENRYLKHCEKMANIMINEGLQVEFEKKRKDYTMQSAQIQKDLAANTQAIVIMEKQLKEGVPVKEPKKVEMKTMTIEVPNDKAQEAAELLTENIEGVKIR